MSDFGTPGQFDFNAKKYAAATAAALRRQRILDMAVMKELKRASGWGWFYGGTRQLFVKNIRREFRRLEASEP